MRQYLLAYFQFSGLLVSVFTQLLEPRLALEASSTASPIVDLGYAQYEGIIDTTTGNTEFLGVRYAAPPTGAQSIDLLIVACC